MQTVAISQKNVENGNGVFSKNLISQKCKPNKLNVLKLNFSILPFSPSRVLCSCLVSLLRIARAIPFKESSDLYKFQKRKSVIIFKDICNMQVTCCCKL